MLKLVTQDLMLHEGDFEEMNFARLELQGRDLRNSNFKDASFRSCDLAGALFNGSDLRGVDFDFANLRRADFADCDLSGASFEGALLDRTKFCGARIRGWGFTHTLNALHGRAWRSDGYEFFIFSTVSPEHPLVIRAGCRTFTPDEFRAHVAKDYPDTPKATETLRIIDFLVAQAESTTLALCGCEVRNQSLPVINSNLTYSLDSQTGLCFASLASLTNGGLAVTSITNVPCTPAVLDQAGASK